MSVLSLEGTLSKERRELLLLAWKTRSLPFLVSKDKE